MRSRTRLLLALTLTASGCATALRPAPSGHVFRPASLGAEYYNANPAAVLLSADERALWNRIRARFAARGQAITLDGALGVVAREYGSEALRARRRPPAELVDFLLAHAGVSEPHPLVFHAAFPAEAASTFVERFARKLERLAQQGVTHIGLAATRAGTHVGFTAALLHRGTSLAPIPRRAPPGAVLPVQGELEESYTAPTLLVTTPRGDVRRAPLLLDGRRFEGRVELSHGQGTYTIEVLAQGPLGPTVVSLFPVECGRRPAAHVRLPQSTPAPSDARVAERQLLRLINEERHRQGLSPLRVNPRLVDLARGHSRDMSSNGFVGHRSPQTGTLSDRLRRAGVTAEISLENIARNDSIDGAHRGLMQSPGHRRNILDPRVREVGVGVVVAGAPNDPQVYITQNFILPVSIVDPLSARAELWSRVREKRARTGVAPLERDEVLDRAAADAAVRLLREGALDAARGEAIVAESLRAVGATPSGLTAQFFIVRTPLEALDGPTWTRAGAMRGGLGVAQRASSAFGDYALCVVLLLAEAGAR